MPPRPPISRCTPRRCGLKRAIVLHWTLAGARHRARDYTREGYEVVEVASPRSLDRLRGVVADRVFYTGGLTTDPRTMQTLLAAVTPCLATARTSSDAGPNK